MLVCFYGRSQNDFSFVVCVLVLRDLGWVSRLRHSGFHVIATTSRYHLVATTCQTLSTPQGCCTSEEQAVAMLRKGGRSYTHDFLSNDTYKRRRKAGRTNGLTCTYVGVFCVLAFLTWYARSAKKLHVVPMPRVPAGSLTKKEFFEQYGDQAVIIEGGLRQHPAVGLGLEGLRDLCGDATALSAERLKLRTVRK